MTSGRPRRRSRAEVSHRRDDEVLSAAAKIFFRRGYADATVQDVADELGILKGSLYHYIDNKEDLLYGLFVELHRDGDEMVLAPVAAITDLTAVERVALLVRRQIEFNIDNLTRIAVFHNDLDRLGPERRRAIAELNRRHEHALTQAIAAALTQSDAPSGPHLDPAVLSRMAHGTMIWLYRWYHADGRLERQEIVDTGTIFVLRAIFATAPPQIVRAAQAAKARDASSPMANGAHRTGN